VVCVKLGEPFFITERAADAPPLPNTVPVADLRGKPNRSYSSIEDAYVAALALDTMETYEQFLALYPSSPYSQRVAAMLAVVVSPPLPPWTACLGRTAPAGHDWRAARRPARFGFHRFRRTATAAQ
jgi:hypothetical protein